MKTFFRILAWLITILLPLALTFLGLRLLLTHAFLEVEYRTPGFPADDYGFTLQDRLHWSKISVDYLLNNADISFLGNLTFPDGSPLFNRARTEPHAGCQESGPAGPVDRVCGLVLYARDRVCGHASADGGRSMCSGLRRGGWLTVGVGGAASVSSPGSASGSSSRSSMSCSFPAIPGCSSIPIRSSGLFPLPFWEDAFLFAGVLDVVGGLALGLGLRPKCEIRCYYR